MKMGKGELVSTFPKKGPPADRRMTKKEGRVLECSLQGESPKDPNKGGGEGKRKETCYKGGGGGGSIIQSEEN